MTDPRPQDAWDVLDAARTALTVHAHPDDETLSTGTVLAHLAGRGARVVLVTATRGEEGETIPGSIREGDPRSFVEVRDDELDRAAAALGVAARCHLGSAPALAPGADARTYRDSGMRWITPEEAGPAEGAGPEAFTRRPRAEAVADLVAAIEAERPDVLISYDRGGTYGHPDHVLTHHVTAAASRATGVPFVEVASYHEADPAAADASFAWRELPGTAEAVERALEAHRTQLSVFGRASATDGAPGAIRIRLSGGQEHAVPLGAGVRLHAATGA